MTPDGLDGPSTLPAGDPGEPGLAAISSWLAARGVAVATIAPLVGDVSSRAYFRVTAPDGSTWIVARYPEELASAQERFTRAARLLESAGLRVPALLADDATAGLALIEDLGPATLYESATSWEELPGELISSVDAIERIARLSKPSVESLGCESLGDALLRRELTQTVDYFLAPRGLAPPALLHALDALCANLAAFDAVPCHRDLMARNLIATGDGGVALLDFQDLRLGPPGYDLASLLNDSLFASEELEAEIVSARSDRIGGEESYLRSVAQRCLKAVGTYAKFAAQGRTRHLVLIEPTLERAVRALSRLPESRDAVAPLAGELARAGAAASAREVDRVPAC